MAPNTQARAALATRQLVPIIFMESRPCWGRLGDGQCDACSLLTEPGATDLRSFPALDVLVPDLVIRSIQGQDTLICRNRRTTGTHRPVAVCGGDSVAVCAVEHHTNDAPADLDAGKPLCVGGGV